MLAPDLADDARHRIGMARAVQRGAGMVDIDAFERGGEAVGIAFAPDLAVGDDVEARPLLRPDGEQRGVVLRLGETRLDTRPQGRMGRAHVWTADTRGTRMRASARKTNDMKKSKTPNHS